MPVNDHLKWSASSHGCYR